MNIIAHRVKPGLVRIPQIKNIIAVTSGKGGVGKSTTAFNLALSLAQMGLKCGILDADIYGPSLPTLVGEKSFKPEVANDCFVPLEKFGLQIISFGFLIDEKQPAIWRGAIVNKALNQLLFDSAWHELDILVIDMPPGTGDIHLTMAQKMPITAVITVTTPQQLALVDVSKSIAMYQKLNIPCLGIVENMSQHICSHCGHSEAIFGMNGAAKLATEFNLPILGKLPISEEICLASDNGHSIIAQNQAIADIYNRLSTELLNQLAKLPRDYASKFGKIATIK